MDSVIYYFSATGNSLKVAKDIASEIEDTKLVKICKDSLNDSNVKGFKKVGIVFPVFYYGLPSMVKKFAENLSLDSNCYVYSVATCGGSVGAAISQLKKIFDKKEAKLSSAFTVLMPDNYQIMFPVPNKEKQKQLFKSEVEGAKRIANIVKIMQPTPFEIEGSFASKLFGGIASSTFNPKEKDKNFWTDNNCNGCGICVKVCPSKDIEIIDNKPKWLHDCEQCLACMQWCPKQSIQYKKSTFKKGRYHHPDIKVSEIFHTANE